MADISASEIQRQSGRVKEELENYEWQTGQIVASLTNCINIIESEDSNLAGTIEKSISSFKKVQSSLSTAFTELTVIMDQFVADTIANETATSEEVDDLESELNDLQSAITEQKNNINV